MIAHEASTQRAKGDQPRELAVSTEPDRPDPVARGLREVREPDELEILATLH